jgi:hypothetical protein
MSGEVEDTRPRKNPGDARPHGVIQPEAGKGNGLACIALSATGFGEENDSWLTLLKQYVSFEHSTH